MARVQVPDDFDARFDCTKKNTLIMSTLPKCATRFLTDRAYRYSYPLDAERMQKGAQFFVGKHDFNAVRSVGTPSNRPSVPFSGAKSTRITTASSVFACVVTDSCIIWFARFRERCSMLATESLNEDVARILESWTARRRGPTLPACGLFMNRLWYDHAPELDVFRLSE